MLSRFSRVRLFVILWTVACQVLLFMEFSRQEYWSGLPCPPLRDLPDPGIELAPLMFPALTGGFFTASVTWEVFCDWLISLSIMSSRFILVIVRVSCFLLKVE